MRGKIELALRWGDRAPHGARLVAGTL